MALSELDARRPILRDLLLPYAPEAPKLFLAAQPKSHARIGIELYGIDPDKLTLIHQGRDRLETVTDLLHGSWINKATTTERRDRRFTQKAHELDVAMRTINELAAGGTFPRAADPLDIKFHIWYQEHPLYSQIPTRYKIALGTGVIGLDEAIEQAIKDGAFPLVQTEPPITELPAEVQHALKEVIRRKPVLIPTKANSNMGLEAPPVTEKPPEVSLDPRAEELPMPKAAVLTSGNGSIDLSVSRVATDRPFAPPDRLYRPDTANFFTYTDGERSNAKNKRSKRQPADKVKPVREPAVEVNLAPPEAAEITKPAVGDTPEVVPVGQPVIETKLAAAEVKDSLNDPPVEQTTEQTVRVTSAAVQEVRRAPVFIATPLTEEERLTLAPADLSLRDSRVQAPLTVQTELYRPQVDAYFSYSRADSLNSANRPILDVINGRGEQLNYRTMPKLELFFGLMNFDLVEDDDVLRFVYRTDSALVEAINKNKEPIIIRGEIVEPDFLPVGIGEIAKLRREMPTTLISLVDSPGNYYAEMIELLRKIATRDEFRGITANQISERWAGRMPNYHLLRRELRKYQAGSIQSSPASSSLIANFE